MAFPIASRRSVSFPLGTRVTYVTRDVFFAQSTFLATSPKICAMVNVDALHGNKEKSLLCFDLFFVFFTNV